MSSPSVLRRGSKPEGPDKITGKHVEAGVKQVRRALPKPM